mgnify:CR=1 FL=1
MNEPINKPNLPGENFIDADITVVIATFNRARFLPEAIDSILNQTIKPKRIIVVDDGSTDETSQVVERYTGAIEYVWKQNGGKSSAINSVLNSIKTKYVWFFDDDDAAYPYALKILLERFKNKPNLGFSFGSYDLAESDTNLFKANTFSLPYLYSDEPLALQRIRLYHSCTISMAGSLIRFDAIIEVKGLDEKLIRSQDYDLIIRLATKYDFEYCGSSVFICRQHQSIRGSEKTQHTAADRDKFFAKYNTIIGLYLRYELPLNAFLLAPSITKLDPENIRDALINRACSVSSKLSPAFAICDLLEAFSLSQSHLIKDTELKILETIFSHESVAYHPVYKLLPLWQLTNSLAGCTALSAISKGIYWLGRSQKRFFDKVRLVSVAIFLFLISKLGKIAWFIRIKILSSNHFN